MEQASRHPIVKSHLHHNINLAAGVLVVATTSASVLHNNYMHAIRSHAIGITDSRLDAIPCTHSEA